MRCAAAATTAATAVFDLASTSSVGLELLLTVQACQSVLLRTNNFKMDSLSVSSPH